MSKQREPLAMTVVVAIGEGKSSSLKRCLAAIRENAPAEVILVDAGASPRTVEAVRGQVDRIIDGGGTIADVHQIGARAASQPWVAFVDPDVVLEPDALYQLTCLSLAERMRARDTALVVGRNIVLGYALDAYPGPGPGAEAEPGLERSHAPIRARLDRLVREEGVFSAVLFALGAAAGLVLAALTVRSAYAGEGAATALVVVGIVLVVMLELAKGLDSPRARAAVAKFAMPVTSLASFALVLAATRLAAVIGI